MKTNQIRIKPVSHYRFEVEVTLSSNKAPLIKLTCTTAERIEILQHYKLRTPISVLFVGNSETVEYSGKVSHISFSPTHENFFRLTVRCDELKYLYGSKTIRTDKINNLSNED